MSCRGTSRFPWDDKRRHIEFPAVSPELLPRLVGDLHFLFLYFCYSLHLTYTASFFRLPTWQKRMSISWSCRAKPLHGRYSIFHSLIMKQRHAFAAYHLTFFCNQAEQSAFDALLRKLPDVVIDFTSAIPARFPTKTIHTKVMMLQGLHDGTIRMTPGQEIVFTAKVRMQPVYSRGILGRYELSAWNMPVEYVRMRRSDYVLWTRMCQL